MLNAEWLNAEVKGEVASLSRHCLIQHLIRNSQFIIHFSISIQHSELQALVPEVSPS